jgi:gamma-carbonic anhydrase
VKICWNNWVIASTLSVDLACLVSLGHSIAAAALLVSLEGMRQCGVVQGLKAQLDRHLRRRAVLGKDVYLASTALVVGDVTLGDRSSVWYGAVLRGDIQRIEVGCCTNIQDNAVLHLADDYPCILGDWVTVGHSAVVHACTVGDECLVGMGSIIMDGAVIGAQSLIAAGALVTPGTQIPPGSMVMGRPGKVVRALTAEERADLKKWAVKYVENAAYCLEHGLHVGRPLG